MRHKIRPATPYSK